MVDTLELPGARALFSTREGGVSVGPYRSLNLGLLTDDEPERVAENRRRLAVEACLNPERVAMGWQVHGAELREWGAPDSELAYAEVRSKARPRRALAARGDKELPRVDGHLTAQRDLGLLVLVADCYPVALADGDQAAMLHCGWRPLAGGIIEKAVDRFARPPAAAVGPGIGGCCYEVGPEVLEHFADVPGAAHGRMLDLRGVIESRLAEAGVTEIAHVDCCTSCYPERYFSHRRDDGVTGRQAGLCALNA